MLGDLKQTAPMARRDPASTESGATWRARVRALQANARTQSNPKQLEATFLEDLARLPGVAAVELCAGDEAPRLGRQDTVAHRFALEPASESLVVHVEPSSVATEERLALLETVVELFAARRSALRRDKRSPAHAPTHDGLIRQVANVGTWIWNIDAGEVEWSDEVFAMWGVDRASFSGTYDEVFERIHPDDRARWKADVQACLDGEKPHELEFRVVRPDGGETWIAAQGDCERDERGRPARMLGVGLDITERRRAETAQRLSAERFRSLMQQTVEGFYLFEFDEPVSIHDPPEAQIDAFYRGSIVECNDAFARMYGLQSGSELVGRTLVDLHGGSDNPENRAFLRACIDNDYRVTGALSEEVDEEGRSVWISNNIMGIVEGEHLMRVWGTQIDVTEARRSEQRQARLQTELARGQRLESLGRLAGGVAHDLNNLLAPIIGYGELLVADLGSPEDTKVMLEGILQAAFRSRDLIRQLLAFGRQQTLEPGAVALDDVVARFEPLMRRTIPADIEIVVKRTPGLEPISADIGQIERVLMNLAVNAGDAMAGGGTLTIETSAVDIDDPPAVTELDVAPGRYVVLTVRDTGGGMDDSTRARAFEPFFSTKGDLGTGLGLPMVYGIVRQHDGFVTIHSTEETGTRIDVHLPVHGDLELMEEEETTTTPDPVGDETVLLVEDDERVRASTRACLERLGYTVLDAADSPGALALLDDEASKVDLLLTDVVLPGMNGRQLADAVTKRHPGVKTLFMSGYTDSVIATRGVRHQRVPFIQKPFTKAALSRKLREALDRGEP